MAQSSTLIIFQSSPCPALVSLVSHLLYPRACCQQWLQSSRDAHNLWCKRRFDSFGKRLSKLWVCVNPPFTGFTGFTMKKLLLLLSPLQSCPTLCNPIDGSPPGSSVPGILQEPWTFTGWVLMPANCYHLIIRLAEMSLQGQVWKLVGSKAVFSEDPETALWDQQRISRL